MKQFKVYKNLTVGYNIAIFFAYILGFTLLISAPQSSWAQGTINGLDDASTTAPATSAATPAAESGTPASGETATAAPTSNPGGVTVVNNNQPSAEQLERQACEANSKYLNDEISKLNSACSATKVGAGCVDKLFKCHSGSADSDECKKIREYENSETRSELDDKINKLKKDKERLEKRKEKLEEDVTKAQGDLEDLSGEQEDLLNEKRLAEEELKEKLSENKSEAARAAEKMQEGIEAIQQKIRELHVSTLEDSNALTNLIASSRIECLAQGREKADRFVQKMRTCTQNGGNCGVNQSTIYAMGKRSLEDLGNQLQARHVRKCMAVNGSTPFGVKYMALQQQIKRKTDFLNVQRAELLTKQTHLQAQIQTLPAQNSIRDNQSLLEKAQADQTLTQKEQKLMMKQLQIAAKIKAAKEKVEEEQQKIDKVDADIAKQEKIKASSLADDDLKRFKEALANIDRIKSFASSNKSCGCSSGPVAVINGYAGNEICDNSSAPTLTPDTTTR